jgi:hypothetical protein
MALRAPQPSPRRTAERTPIFIPAQSDGTWRRAGASRLSLPRGAWVGAVVVIALLGLISLV